MNEIITRTLSGILYVAVLTASMFYSTLAFYGIICLFACLALWEFQRLIQFSHTLGLLLLIGLFTLSYFDLLPHMSKQFLLGMSLLVNLWVSYLCIYQKKVDFRFGSKSLLTLFYLIGSSLFIPLLLEFSLGSPPYALFFFYGSIWVNNSFAYLIGSRFGKTKLFPAISPKKSWEGYWGGTLATLVFLAVLEKQFSLFGNKWIIIGISIPFLATLGDFVQSYFKRRANVKDSGTLLPGHGGFYDRMDSVIFTAPFYYLLLKFL